MTTESITKDSFKMLQMTEKETTQILIEEDILVPDIKPDLANIVSIEGKTKIVDKDIANGKLKCTGKMNLKILYVPVENRADYPLVPMDAVVDFRNELDYLISDKSDVEISVNVEHMDYSIINERKLKVKAVANITTKYYQLSNMDFVSKSDNEDIQFLKKQIKYTDIIERKKATIDINEELNIKEDMPEIGQILNWDINIYENQKQIINDRAVINATVQYNILYLSDEIEPTPVLFRDTSEFTQFIDIQNVEGNVDSKVDFILNYSNITLKQDIEENVTLLEANIDIQTDLEITKLKEKEILIDAYHPKKQIELEKDKIDCKMICGKGAAEIPIREIVTLPDMKVDAAKIVNVTAKVIETNSYVENDKDIVEGVLIATILYQSTEENKNIMGIKEEIPFRHAIEIQGLSEDYEMERDMTIRKIDFELMNSKQIEINSDVYMKSVAYCKETHDVLTKVLTLDEVVSIEADPSIIVYVINKDDNLWKIAKKYRTTIEEIKIINNIEDEQEIKSGEKLILLKNCQ